MTRASRVPQPTLDLSRRSLFGAVLGIGALATLQACGGDAELRWRLVIGCGVAIGAGLALSAADLAGPAAAVFTLAAAIGGVYPARRAWTAIRLRTLDINALMVIAVAGALTVVVDDTKRKERVRLDTPATGLLIPPNVWIETEEWTEGAVLLMLASERHDPADYIRDYSGLAAREP